MTSIPPGPWNLFPAAWDKLVLNDREWPGLARVDVSGDNKWDTKKAQGSHGGEREFKGADLAKVDIELRIWTNDDFEQVVGLFDVIRPVPGKKKPDVIKIGHAVTGLWGIFEITIDGVQGPKVQGGQGVLSISATEHRPPSTKNASGKAKGGGGTICSILAAQIQNAAAKLITLQLEKTALFQNPLEWEKVIAKDKEIAAAAIELDVLRASQVQAGCNEAKPSATQSDDADTAEKAKQA